MIGRDVAEQLARLINLLEARGYRVSADDHLILVGDFALRQPDFDDAPWEVESL